MSCKDTQMLTWFERKMHKSFHIRNTKIHPNSDILFLPTVKNWFFYELNSIYKRLYIISRSHNRPHRYVFSTVLPFMNTRISVIIWLYFVIVACLIEWSFLNSRYIKTYFIFLAKWNTTVKLGLVIEYENRASVDHCSWPPEKNSNWGVANFHADKPQSTHYDDVIMTMLASQITSLTVVYSIVYSGVNQRKHQSSASLAFVWEIHRGPVNFPHKWPVTRKMFPFDDVIMRPTEWPI